VGKIWRGNYTFVTWVGDHAPYHVHVFRQGRLVPKWDLENECAMARRPTRRILRLIAELRSEGKL
jgi:hypothetical protein